MEKILKALATKKLKKPAPYSHNLSKLAELTNLSFSEEQLNLLDEITAFNIEARYNGHKFQFYKKATKEYTQKYLRKTKEIYLWLKKRYNPRDEKKVLEFVEIIEDQGIPIEKAIIFGSYAKNKASEESDIDLCLISSKFGKDSIEELQFLLKQRRKIEIRIEPIPVSLKDYQRDATPLILEIKKFGKEIFV